MSNNLEKLNEFAGYIKDEKQIAYDTEIKRFRETFDLKKFKDIKELVEDYLLTIPEHLKSSYDKKELIVYLNDVKLPEAIVNRCNSDKIDFFRYSYYYKEDDVSVDEILKIIDIPIDKESYVSLDGTTYIWNARKEAFNKLRHKIGLYDTVTILQSDIKTKILQANNRYLIFSIADIGEGRKYFAVVEIEIKEDVIRIINCRRSSEKEMLKEEVKYENNK